jgi:hypothetical protein
MDCANVVLNTLRPSSASTTASLSPTPILTAIAFPEIGRAFCSIYPLALPEAAGASF